MGRRCPAIVVSSLQKSMLSKNDGTTVHKLSARGWFLADQGLQCRGILQAQQHHSCEECGRLGRHLYAQFNRKLDLCKDCHEITEKSSKTVPSGAPLNLGNSASWRNDLYCTATSLGVFGKACTRRKGPPGQALECHLHGAAPTSVGRPNLPAFLNL